MSVSGVSTIDDEYMSEEGEFKIQKSPSRRMKSSDGLPFSLSEEDGEDTADSLDIKPPQAVIRSHKSSRRQEHRSRRMKEKKPYDQASRSHRDQRDRSHRDVSDRDHRERDYRDRDHRERERDLRVTREQRGFRDQPVRDEQHIRDERHRERKQDKDHYKERSRHKHHHREKLYNDQRKDQMERSRHSDQGHLSEGSYRDPQEVADGKVVSRDRNREHRSHREHRENKEYKELKDDRDLKERRHQKEKRSFNIQDAAEHSLGEIRERELRERLLDRKMDEDSPIDVKTDRHKRTIIDLEDEEEEEIKEQLTTEEQAERESRRMKLLEAEREMLRQKEVYRRELEARRARRQMKEEEVEEQNQEEDEEKDDLTQNVKNVKIKNDWTDERSDSSSRSVTGGSSPNTGTDDRPSEADEDDKTPTTDDKPATASEAVEKEPEPEPMEQDNQDEEHDLENGGGGGEEEEPTSPGSASSPIPDIEGLDDLPPYLPAIQGCRSVDAFQRLNRIEEGTYGVVYRAKDKQTGKVVALKRLKMEKEKEGFPITSLREINTLLKAQHQNIVTVREIVVGASMDEIFIVMDYVAHDLKSLMETMREKKQVFIPGEVKCLMQQLLSAVAHLHDNWILHRDLKTSNLLLSHEGILKVGDFGLAREYGSPLKPYTPIVVTRWYRSPELLLGVKEYSTPIDVWSVGCIFAEFLKMEPLFPGTSERDQINRIFRVLGTPNEVMWPGYSKLPLVQSCSFTKSAMNKLRGIFAAKLTEPGLDLLNKFLTYDPEQRITAEEALAHSYFKEAPLAIDPSMFPTWPAKSELTHRKTSSPKPPSGGKEFQQMGEGEEGEVAAMGFHMGAVERTRLAVGAGFSLKF